MSITHEEIVAACRPVLEAVGFYTTEKRHERRFITAYQVWFLLKENNDPICDKLIEECKGEFVGKDAGSHVGPAQRIGKALGHCSDIETQKMATRFLKINNMEPTGIECGIFRLR